MTDLLSIGSSALLAYRSALNVVGQNVANANTEGYSRQRIELQNTNTSGTSVGTGVTVRTVARLGDEIVFGRLVSQDSSYARIAAFQSQAASVDGWLSGSATGLSTPLNGFFDALNTLTSGAGSTATRQVLLQSASTLAARFNDLQTSFNQTDQDIDAALTDAATQINTLSAQIAKLNQRVSEHNASNPGQTANDLLDQRDTLVRQLAQQVGIETTSGADGAINITLGSGQALVLGNAASTASVGNDIYGRKRELLVTSSTGQSTTVTQQVSGGIVGGLLDFRREVLDPAVNQLGAMAAALASAVNAQHAEGMDQYGDMGSALFTMPTGTVKAATTNNGNASVAMSIGDAGALGTQDYALSYNGSSWSMVNAVTGASIALSGSGTASAPLVGGGVSLTLSGTAAAGDRFLLQPTQSAAGQIKLAISDPARIAAAGPIRTTVGSSNTGLGSIGTPEVLDAGNPALLDSVSIAFNSDGTYSVNGAGSYAYTDGGNIDINGWRVQISGQPAAGDSFTLSRNDGSSGDNGNAKLLGDIANLALLGGGRNTLTAANTALVTQVGSQASQADTQLSAQSALRSQTQTERDSLSGVNLDEEAADLMRFQQAYQAAAQVVSTANSLFDSLLAAVRS